MLTCTSGCPLEVWLNRAWVSGHVEGDGEDYWFFADTGGRFLLAEHMKARYTEHRWRSGVRDISGICSSPSIRLMSHNEILEILIELSFIHNLSIKFLTIPQPNLNPQYT